MAGAGWCLPSAARSRAGRHGAPAVAPGPTAHQARLRGRGLAGGLQPAAPVARRSDLGCKAGVKAGATLAAHGCLMGPGSESRKAAGTQTAHGEAKGFHGGGSGMNGSAVAVLPRRADAGTVRLSLRDVAGLVLLGDMYGA